MKNVLLLVHDDAGQEARLQAALDLARALNGHLTCLDVTLLPILAGEDLTGAGTAMVMQAEREREGANKVRLQDRLAREDVAWSWLDTTNWIPDAVLDAAKLADVVVLNCKLESAAQPDMRRIAARVVTQAGTPIIAMPEAAQSFSLDRALVAWDGSDAVSATLRAAVPILALAKDVEIFMVRDGAEEASPEEAAEYLSRHGIHAEIRTIDDGRTSADRLIREESQRWRADYILMGAYNHGTLVETFGGVSRSMLADSTVPLVLGH